MPPPVSPSKELFVSQDVAHLRQIPSSADMSTEKDANSGACCESPGQSKCTNGTQEQICPPSLLSKQPHLTLNDPKSRHARNPAATTQPICRPLSVLNTTSDVEAGAPSVCPCCHLRRRSSMESVEPRSPKYVHTVLDDCCSIFCPDLSLPLATHSPNARQHIGHSRLCEQVQSPPGVACGQLAEVQSSPCSSDNYTTAGRCADSVEENDASCWAAGDYD
jgi:hypothetical protein